MNKTLRQILTTCIAMVWLINGLVCKILNLVPRHQQIVARILGDEMARPMTVLIGSLEVGMAVWVISGWRPRWNSWTQISVVMTMNVIEFVKARDLLLFGAANIVFASLFSIVVYVWGRNESLH